MSMYYIQHQTGAVINQTAGLIGTVETKIQYLPKASTEIFTDNLFNNTRIWFALENWTQNNKNNLTNLNGTANWSESSPGLGSPSYIGIMWQNVSGTPGQKTHQGVYTTWQCCSGNGTVGSCTNTGVTVVANVSYTLQLQMYTTSNLGCDIYNGTSWFETNKSTFLPNSYSNEQLRLRNTITTGAALAKNYMISWMYLRT